MIPTWKTQASVGVSSSRVRTYVKALKNDEIVSQRIIRWMKFRYLRRKSKASMSGRAGGQAGAGEMGGQQQ